MSVQTVSFVASESPRPLDLLIQQWLFRSELVELTATDPLVALDSSDAWIQIAAEAFTTSDLHTTAADWYLRAGDLADFAADFIEDPAYVPFAPVAHEASLIYRTAADELADLLVADLYRAL